MNNIATLADNVIQSRAGGKVERCHGIPHNGSYSNAAHQWGVALLLYYLWPADFPRLAIYCLTHDVPEFLFGDIPAPSTRYIPGLRKQLGEMERRSNLTIGLPAEQDLSPEDYKKLKACDALEFWLWCSEQLATGNAYALEPRDEVERYFSESPLPEEADALWKQLNGQSILPRQAGMVKSLAGVQS